mgnify:CR=1 FL=1
MGFYNKDGLPLINEEHKVRITLSHKAKIIMAEDMNVFKVAKETTFINTVFRNYRKKAKSSISVYLEEKELEFDHLFSETSLDKNSKRIAINSLLEKEMKELKSILSGYKAPKETGKIYHIDNENCSYLLDDSNENKYYRSPGPYMCSVIEEYCSLPFIKRERIFRKEVYETVEDACKYSKLLKVKADYYGKEQVFYVYPYKIVPDPFHTQSYLVCYSRKAEEDDSTKIIASFSMARLNISRKTSRSFYLNADEINALKKSLSKDSPAYLVGKPEKIEVRLTKKGKQSYQARLYSRPERITSKDTSSSDDIYKFNCTQQQAFNYFFSFGPEAEIISPQKLRDRFHNTYKNSLVRYE